MEHPKNGFQIVIRLVSNSDEGSVSIDDIHNGPCHGIDNDERLNSGICYNAQIIDGANTLANVSFNATWNNFDHKIIYHQW